ncbi:MAG: polymerase, sigma-24 subunit, subfamily [Acidimicrobiales bacterium]|nr:polymerase, sigma-24 subunit, subfamily [Acidimicrobiales bacterium]
MTNERHPAADPLRTHIVRDDFSSSSDASLVVAIGRYKQAALAEAYRRHAGAVFGLAKRLLLDHAQAEEIVQEVFLRLWNEPDRFDPDRGSLRSFLLAHTHGRSVDSLRSNMSRRRREDRDAHLAADAGYDVDREVWDITLASQVRDALAELKEGERAAIEMAYFGGLTYREVAERLGEAEGTVKSRIRVGLKRLRTDLQAAGITLGDH